MEYVKICGLKSYKEIQVCKQYGADAVGFIYDVPRSPRNLGGTEINGLAKKIGNSILTVGVSKPSNMSDLKSFIRNIDVNYYQIHSNFNETELAKIPKNFQSRIILALKLNSSNINKVIRSIKRFHGQFYAILIDNSEGHGNKLDINLLKNVLNNTENAKLILAGGINSNNVEKIILDLNPYGIDVSSALESKRGIKDPSKIKHFLIKIKQIKKNLRM
jgi:phosphoribosylanthranilate isomerase